MLAGGEDAVEIRRHPHPELPRSWAWSSSRTADNLIPLVFPISMISNSFVPTAGMPVWLRAIADWNPVSALVMACRELFGNAVPTATEGAWPLAHPYVATIGWSPLLLCVFVPLATWRHRTANR